MEFRLCQLRRLTRFLVDKHDDLLKALEADFKSHFEAKSELLSVQSEAVKAIDNLAGWMTPSTVKTPLAFWMDSCQMRSEPRGPVLIIAPWNYPLDLLLTPLIGAIAAGCTAVLKPAEQTRNTVAFLEEFLFEYLDPECFQIVTGGASETTVLLDWPNWGLIFFTGSGRVGQIVHAKAAKNLIPTILELGGKSPCIVAGVPSDFDLQTVAKRIIYGKLFNAGQTCVAPDYLLLTNSELLQPLKEQLLMAIKTFYGDEPSQSTDYSRIVDTDQWDRLSKLLKDGEKAEQMIQVGGSDREARSFAPTLVIKPDLETGIMTEEIFGPILVLVVVSSLDEAISFIRARPKPLAMYLFSPDSSVVDRVTRSISCGGCTINDTMMHVFSGCFPLGGVGPSGMGAYRGRQSFETFSHQKPFMWCSLKGEMINDQTRNPPLSDTKMSITSRAIFSAPKVHHLAD